MKNLCLPSSDTSILNIYALAIFYKIWQHKDGINVFPLLVAEERTPSILQSKYSQCR